LEGYTFYRLRSPHRIASLEARIARFEYELNQAGVDPSDLSLPTSPGRTIFGLGAQVLICALSAPFALLGGFIHYPAYRLGGFVALRLARREQDVVSTFKIISAMLLFPLTWIVVALISWKFGGWFAGLVAMIITPLCGDLAVRFFEEMDRFIGS